MGNDRLLRRHRSPSRSDQARSTKPLDNYHSAAETLLDSFLTLSPFGIIFVLIIVFANVLSTTPSERASASVSKSLRSTEGIYNKFATRRRCEFIVNAPSLNNMIANVADALDSQEVTFWLMPGLGLLPATDGSAKTFGRLSPWQEGVDFGVNHGDIMRIILAQTSLQWRGIVAVESYFGLRLFHVNGSHDERYDYNVPFVDLVYFQIQEHQVVSQCCDCSPVVAGSCTKKSCDCLTCSAQLRDVFPLRHLLIQDVPRALPAPCSDHGLLLPSDVPGVHPALFDDPV